jgi:hypothetical protein
MTDENPLSKFKRKSFDILNLPSKGLFWKEGSLNYRPNMTVLPMTGRDESLLLSATGVLLGSIVAEIVQRCVPEIVDPWEMPRVDLDAVMISIRCASYGTHMKVAHKCPHCEKVHNYTVDLTTVANSIELPNYDNPLILNNGLTIWFKPLTLKESNDVILDQNRKTAVIQKITRENISEDEKAKLIKDNLWQLTADTVKALTLNISKIVADVDIVDNPAYIENWLLEADLDSYTAVQNQVEKIVAEYKIPKIKAECFDCHKDFEIEVEFNPADFLSKSKDD